tara:strand:- start:654 stop:2444 length:1791 start_codon:yes stop_codon:yes gene_type:complete
MANQRLKIDVVAQDKSKQALGRVQANLSKVRQSVFNLRNAFIGIGAGVVLKGFFDAGIQIENLGVQLKALFGSAERGKKALKQVTDFASGTPFELRNIQQGITALATVSEKAESLGISFDELLKITGNTATVLGGDFALASLQIQRSFSAGIGSAELFRERGVRAMAGFKEGVQVSTDESIKGLAKAFGTGGKFGNLIDELAQTLFGTISNLKDAFFIFQVEVSEGFFGVLKEQLGGLKSEVEENKRAIAEFGNSFGRGLGNVIQTTSKLLVFLKEQIDLIILALRVLIGLKVVAFFHNMAVAIGVANGAMLGFNATIRKNLLIAGGIAIISHLDKIIKKVLELRDALFPPQIQGKNSNDFEGVTTTTINKGKRETFGEAILRNFRALKTTIADLNTEALQKMKTNLTTIGEIIAKSVNSGIKKTSDGIARSVIMGEKLADTFRKMAQEVAVRLLSAIIEMGIRMAIQFVLKQKELAVEKAKTGEMKRQLQIQTAMMAMSGNPMAIFGFMGFQHGGAVSKGKPIVVGERGAELFVPNQTGQITQNARGMDGQAVNVNFTINAVDASGIDRLLVERRGTISRIINESVNERGVPSLI